MVSEIVYSCDSHVVEGPEVFDGLVEKFGDRAPRVVDGWKGRQGVYLAWPQIDFAMLVGRLGIAGANLNLPETKEKMQRGWDLINPGVKDPVARLTEQDTDGVVGEVMYPSINMLTYMVDDVEVVNAVFQRHNDWIRDYCSHSPERLIGVGCLTLRDVEVGIAELERCANMGIKGVAIPCTAPKDKPYSDAYYEPFWTAAEEAGLPLTMHIFCGAEPGMGLPKEWDEVVSYTLAHSAAWNTISNLVTSGVCERHPGLKFVMAEWETGWIAHTLERWDHAYYRARAVD
ncbi:MAG: amidohydrolase, partial [Chloroflexi bacterium]|nr:amidohydrolase [Chloroflexota bacterium]